MSDQEPTFIVGLGNPGRDYEETRHNIGFYVVDTLVNEAASENTEYEFSGKWSEEKGALVQRGKISGKPVWLVKPLRYMNRSGGPVFGLMKEANISPKDLIVVLDDIDLSPGMIRIRKGGGDGGHRGLRSIIDVLGSRDFIRFRIGVGRPGDKQSEDVADWVLCRLSSEEKEFFAGVAKTSGEAIRVLLEEGVQKAQNQFNG